MTYRRLAFGEPRPRLRAVGATALCLLVFLPGSSAGRIAFGTFSMLFGLAIALYAGVKGGGLLIAQSAVFGCVCWRAVFPPLIGLLRWDDAARYTTIRWNHLFLGTTAYGLGALYRHLRRDDPAAHPYVEN